jgi:hypothetical protein
LATNKVSTTTTLSTRDGEWKKNTHTEQFSVVVVVTIDHQLRLLVSMCINFTSHEVGKKARTAIRKWNVVV